MTQRKLMRVLALVLFLSSMSFGSQVVAAQEGDSKKDPGKQEKVATVNGVAIEREELDKAMGRIEQRMAMMGQAPTGEQVSEIRKNVLENLIDAELIHQEAQKQNIKVSDEEVSQRIAALQKLFPNEADFKETLDKAGMTQEDLKTQVRRELAVKNLVDQQVVSKISIPEKDIKAYYDNNPEHFKAPEQVCAAHILIKVDEKAEEAEKVKARQKMVEIQERVKKGEDFAALAKEHSDCPSKEKGGDLGCFQQGQMVGPFEKVAFELKPGEVSDIVETQFGYHLIKVSEKKPARTVPYEEVKEKIEQYLKKEETDKQMSQYLEQLKGKAKIERFALTSTEPPKEAAQPPADSKKADKSEETKESAKPKPAKE